MGEGLKERAAKLAAAARALNAAGGPLAAEAPFALAYATDRRRGPDAALVAQALPAGAAIIFRDYDDPRRAANAAKLRKIGAERGVLFLVGGDARLAADVGADGIHLRSDQLRNLVPTDGRMIVSASCHNADEIARARSAGAHVLLVGPVFSTESHPGAAALEVEAFLALAAGARLPVLAIGGVDETAALRLAGCNVAGFAAIGAFAAK